MLAQHFRTQQHARAPRNEGARQPTTGREAIGLAQSTPDLAIVLMDIMMPEMDGYQTIAAIRDDPAFRSAAHHRAYGEGNGRATARNVLKPGPRVSRQTREHRATAVSHAKLAASIRAQATTGSDRVMPAG